MTALWPISSTTIMAVSWSSGWLMVTICPSFINCLITSEALTAILCASSATVMVSGTCTSMMRASTGAVCTGVSSRSRSRLPRGPPRQLLRPTPPLASPRVLISFFLACSSAQLEESLALLTSFWPSLVVLEPAGFAPGAVLPEAGLCKVPLIALGSGVSVFSTAGFFATSTFLGAFIIERMASASANAVRRLESKSLARAASSSALALAAASRSSASALALAALASPLSSSLAVAGSSAIAEASRSLASCASRRRRFSANSSSCRRMNSAWRRASSSRLANSAWSRIGAAGVWTATGSSVSLASASSRLTKVRFLRTST